MHAYKHTPQLLNKPTVYYIVICAHDNVGQVTLLVASMADPVCRIGQTTSSFPNLAALISSVSSLSCQSRTEKIIGKPLVDVYTVQIICNNQT